MRVFGGWTLLAVRFLVVRRSKIPNKILTDLSPAAFDFLLDAD